MSNTLYRRKVRSLTRPGSHQGAFTIGELTGNRSALRKIARDALDKLDDFEEVEEPA